METEIIKETLNSRTEPKNQNKVTIGFKCRPEIKSTLSNEARQLGITLSEYVESLILNKQEANKLINIESEQNIKTVNELKQKLAFYENNFLTDLFNEHKNKVVIYKNRENKSVELKINEINDIYTILINSFKINKP